MISKQKDCNIKPNFAFMYGFYNISIRDEISIDR